jgi:hypothetical protein
LSSKGDLMIGNEAVRGSPDADELLGATFDETELTQMAVTDADWLSVQVTDADLKSMAADIEDVLAMTDSDWMRLRLTQDALIRVRDDLIGRVGVRAQELTWLNRAIERGKHGHKGAQTGADRTQTAKR